MKKENMIKTENILYTGGGVNVYFETLDNGITFMIESTNYDYYIAKNINSEEKFLEILDEDDEETSPFFIQNQSNTFDCETERIIKQKINKLKGMDF